MKLTVTVVHANSSYTAFYEFQTRTAINRLIRAGAGVFYSTDTGRTVHGRWTEDALDGPCNVVLSTGRRPNHTNLVFRQNVLHGTRPSAPAVVRGTSRYAPGPSAPAVVRGRRLPAARRNKVDPVTVEPAETIAYDLSGHVRRASDKWCTNSAVQVCVRGAASASTVIADDSETEIRAAELALGSSLSRLRDVYRAFSTDGGRPVIVYRTLMTRLGLWRMLVDCGLHGRVSLVDFGQSLCEHARTTADYNTTRVYSGAVQAHFDFRILWTTLRDDFPIPDVFL